MKWIIFPLLFSSCLSSFAQKTNAIPLALHRTAIKWNINGLRISVEQKITNNTTTQLALGYWGRNYITLNPQIRYYPSRFKKRLGYFAIGYFYKHQEYGVSDSVKLIGTNTYYLKHFDIGKYIHAVTLNYGWYFYKTIAKQNIFFEFNTGLGVRFKKSNRYGLATNEEIDFREAFIIRRQAEQDTKGSFKLYPELNLTLSAVVPLWK